MASSPAAAELAERLATLVRRGFTGRVEVEFSDGVPRLVRTTETHRFAKPNAPPRLTEAGGT